MQIVNLFSTSLDKTLKDFFTFQHNFSSPQVKRKQVLRPISKCTTCRKHHQILAPRHFRRWVGFAHTRKKKKTYYLWKSENQKKIHEILESDGKYTANHPKAKLETRRTNKNQHQRPPEEGQSPQHYVHMHRPRKASPRNTVLTCSKEMTKRTEPYRKICN